MTNDNVIKTLKALIELGLDVKTGESPKIFMKNLEHHSGLRQTSNGSRIIRRDSEVFGMFNIAWNYSEDDGKLLSVTFNGYKTSSDIVKGLYKEEERLTRKIQSLEPIRITNRKAIQWTKDNTLNDLSCKDLLYKITGEEFGSD